MILVTQDRLGDFRQTNRLLCEESLRRGLEVRTASPGGSQIRIKGPDGAWRRIYSSVPFQTSYQAALLSDNKYATHIILSEAGLPVMPTIRIGQQEDIPAVYASLSNIKQLVVKPLNGSHGDGITVGIETFEEFERSVEMARTGGKSKIIIAQEMYEDPIDIRILCLDYKYMSAIHRIPARIKGDGIHTVRELIELENTSPDRGERYVARLGIIEIDRVEENLGAAINEIPADGEWVQVMMMANYGAGGETAAITQSIPDWLKRMAEQAAIASVLPLCGVDFLVKKVPATDDTQDDLQPTITELNKCPSLYIHEHPTNTAGDKVVGPFIDYVLSES